MRRWLHALLCALFPQRTVCHACGAPLMGEDGLLCPVCEASLRACAVPKHQVETVVDVHIETAAAPFVYDGAAAALVKALKFGGDHTAALPLAEGMAAAYTTANQELGQRGMTKQLQSMQELFKKSATGKRVEIPEQDSELGKTLILWEDLRMKAYDSFSLPQPDWDAPTTDSLEKEVHAFVNRVTDAIKNMRPRAALR
mgnify:CR=1 FL=1